VRLVRARVPELELGEDSCEELREGAAAKMEGAGKAGW